MTTKIKILAVIALIGLSACNNDDNTMPVSHIPADGVIRIVTDETVLQTRSGSTTDNINSFNLCINPKGEIIDSAYIYNDIRMRRDFGPWTAKIYDASTREDIPTNMFWQDRTTPVEVTAISMPITTVSLTPDGTYHYRHVAEQDRYDGVYYKGSDVSFFKGCVNPTLLTDVKDAAGNVSEYALKDGCIRIPFRHIMSKLNITLTLGTDLNTTPGTTENPVTRLNVMGTSRTGIIHFKDGSVTANTSFPDIDSVVPLPNNAAYIPGVGTTTNAVAKYECILVPQTIAANNFWVQFILDGKSYAWCSVPPVTLESGKEYFLSINLSNEAMTPQKTSALRRGYDRTKSSSTNEPPYIPLDGAFAPQSSPWLVSDKRQDR